MTMDYAVATLYGACIAIVVYRTFGGFWTILVAGAVFTAVLMFETYRAAAERAHEVDDADTAYERWAAWQ